ncbi:MAG: endonuclease/exonuclease/phosphatase family protein [Patescibacteria group bacterium]
MKIISLNTWAGRIHQPLMDFFKKNKDIDIFCLQEIYHEAEGKEPDARSEDAHNLFIDIKNALPLYEGYFRPAFEDFYGQAIFIRKNITIEEEGDVFIFENNNPEQRGIHSRNLQYIRLNISGKPTLIANVHGLWNGQGKTDTPDRLEQSRKISEFLNKSSDQKILCGDFNLSPDTESLAIVEKGMRNLVKEHGITSTRTSFYDKENKFADYILVSSEVIVKDFRVLPDEVSDHSPLLIEIE